MVLKGVSGFFIEPSSLRSAGKNEKAFVVMESVLREE